MRILPTVLGAVLFVIGGLAAPHIASACDVTEPSIPLASAIVSARHTAPRADDKDGVLNESLRWDARYIVDVDAAFDFKGGLIPFAVALPSDTKLIAVARDAGVVTAITDWGGHITGICAAPTAIHDRTINASFLQSSSPHVWSAEETTLFNVPIAKSNVVQIIDSSFTTDIRLMPTNTTVLERHVGYIAPAAIGHDAREEARRLTDTKVRVTATPIYLRGDDLRAMNGLEGHITNSRARSKGTSFGVGALFAGMVGALIFAARRLKNAANEEHADAVLRSKIDALDDLAKANEKAS